MDKTNVAVIMGSDSDLEIMAEAVKILWEFGVDTEVRVMSAHRTPHVVAEFAANAKKKGTKAIIAGAGGAAHLAGVVAAHTTLPVIGVPIPMNVMDGLDSLLSTVQMPGGIPVATVAIGKAGAKNAALLAIQIMATSDETFAKKLDEYRSNMVQKVRAKDEGLKEKIKSFLK